MSFAEDMLSAHLDQQTRKRPKIVMSTSGFATGRMWLGLDTIHGAFASTRRANEIIRAVLFVTGVSRLDFISHRRWRSYAEARQIAYWFMRNYTTLSTTQIGRFVGDRDHATILHGIKRVNAEPVIFGDRMEAVAHVLGVHLPPACG